MPDHASSSPWSASTPPAFDDYPHQFSGGMRQRAAIAMALALEPKLIIADEPVTALDVVIQRQILDTFNALQERLGLSVVLVTHDISVIAYTCDQVVVMYAGQIVEAGPVGEVLARPAHPYTMGLYNAFPDLLGAGGELAPIEGSPPDLADPPQRAADSATAVPFAIDRMRRPAERRSEIATDHRAACWRIAEADTLRKLRRRQQDLGALGMSATPSPAAAHWSRPGRSPATSPSTARSPTSSPATVLSFTPSKA